MSFGYSVGDFIAIGTLAWNLYKSCKGAPESFGDISSEVLSLHVVLKEVEEEVFARPLSPTKQERLKAIGDGCYRVLKDLDNLVKKYQSLGTQSKRTWDRMRWGTEDIAELRARLTSNTGLLTAWISISQVSVEKKLDEFLKEFRDGHRQGSVISIQTLDSLCTNDKQVWHTIRKELEDIGITIAAFDAHKDFIFEWFAQAIASGAFEEQSPDDSLTAKPCKNSSVHKLEETTSRAREQLGLKTQQCDAPVLQVAMSFPPRMGPFNAGAMLSSNDETRNRLSVRLLQKVAAPRPRIPPVAALIAGLSRPSKRLVTAVKERDFSKACEILNNQRKVGWLDSKSFAEAMCGAADQGQEQVVRLLLEKNANLNATGDSYSSSALQCASKGGHKQVVRLLIEKGADVNAAGNFGNSALHCASENGHEQVVRLLLEKGAKINAAGPYQYSALQCASRYGQEPVVRLLLEKGAEINTAGQHQDSALQYASKNGHERVVQLLLEKGADVNAHGKFRDSALHYASKNGHKQVVRLLLERGADVNAAGEYHNTALQCASMNEHEQIVRLLLEKGACRY